MRYGREKTQYIGEERVRLRAELCAGKPLSDKDLLALLLNYPEKRRDTSAAAEWLLYRFHGFAGVLDAPARVLGSIRGVGPDTAALLKTVPALLLWSEKNANAPGKPGRGSKCRSNPVRRLRVRDRDEKVPLRESLRRMRRCFSDTESECEGVMILGRRGAPISFCRIGRGEHGVLTSDLRACAAELFRTGTAGVIVAHNHPDGPAVFSDSDRLAAEEIFSVLNGLRVRTVCHVVFGKQRRFTFCRGRQKKA